MQINGVFEQFCILVILLQCNNVSRQYDVLKFKSKKKGEKKDS